MAACELALAGVHVTVLERRVERVKQSRAFTIHSRTIEIMGLRGLAEHMLDEGIQTPTGHYGALETRLDFTSLDTRFPFVLFLPQLKIEGILEERAVELGVDLRRGHLVETIQQQNDSVQIAGTASTQRFEIYSRYVVGADGARSVVRRQIGFDFPGSESNASSYFGDVIVRNPPSPGPFSIRNERGGVLAAPIGDGYHRVILLDPLRAHIPVSVPVTLEEMREAAQRIIGSDIGITDPVWMSRVGNETRLVTSYRQGRVFLAGDAAHIHMPAGGQGLNVGLQDAMNLAWKLAGVLRGWAPDNLLDSYDRERRPVGEALIESTLTQASIMTNFNREGLVLRQTLNQLLLVPIVNRQLALEVSAFAVSYPEPILPDISSLNPEWAGKRLRDESLQLSDGSMTTLYALQQRGDWIALNLVEGEVSIIPPCISSKWIKTVRATAIEPKSRLRDLRTILIRPDGHVASVVERSLVDR